MNLIKLILISVLISILLPLLITAEIETDGKLMSVMGKVVALDVGSSDGVTKGLQGKLYNLEKHGEKHAHQPVGTFRITDVFSRGSIAIIWKKTPEVKIQAGVTEYRFYQRLVPPKFTSSSKPAYRVQDGKPIDYYFVEAKKFEKNGELEKALLNYKKLESLLPGDKLVGTRIPKLKKRIEKARADAREEAKARELRSRELGKVSFYRLAMRDSFESDDEKQAIEYAKKILTVLPDDDEAYGVVYKKVKNKGENARSKPKPETLVKKSWKYLPGGMDPNFDDDIKVTPPECYYKHLPIYPDLARRAKLHGTVILQVIWDTKGRIRNAKVMSSPGKQFGFDAAAIEAVKKWRCTPAIAGGIKVEIYGTVTVNFVLGNNLK